jgi:hypothetical protein
MLQESGRHALVRYKNIEMEVNHGEKDSRLTILAKESLRSKRGLSVSSAKSRCRCCSVVANI